MIGKKIEFVRRMKSRSEIANHTKGTVLDKVRTKEGIEQYLVELENKQVAMVFPDEIITIIK